MIALPPDVRSDAALKLVPAAIEDRFLLQRCRACATVHYPPAEFCRTCLDTALDWEAVAPDCKLLAITEIHRSIEPYFQDRTPLSVGLVKLAAGPVAMAYLDRGCVAGDRLLLSHRLDASGRAVMYAVREGDDPSHAGLSTMVDGVCALASPDPRGAADRIAEALTAAGWGDIRIDDGRRIRVTAYRDARMARVDLHHGTGVA